MYLYLLKLKNLSLWQVKTKGHVDSRNDILFGLVIFTIDDLHISHNASGMKSNIQVLLICSSSSHSSLVVNSLELPCLATTLRLYETMVIRVVCSCAVDAKFILSKTETYSLLYDRKFHIFLTFLARVIDQNISLRYVANHSHNQFYKIKMLFKFCIRFHLWIGSESKIFLM